MMLLAFALMVSNAASFEAVTSGSIGWMAQKGQESVLAYSVGTGIPIVKKASAGFSLKAAPDYLYSDGFNGQEVQVIRFYLIAEKDLLSGMRAVAGKTLEAPMTMEMEWRIYFLTGSGTWQFIKTGQLENNDQSFGAFKIGAGGDYKDLSLSLSLDIVQVDGPDILYPNVGFKVKF